MFLYPLLHGMELVICTDVKLGQKTCTLPMLINFHAICNQTMERTVQLKVRIEHETAYTDFLLLRTVVNLSSGETVIECQKCLELETELVKKKDFVDKETYDKLCKCFTTLEKHCITLELELKAQSQAKDTVIVKLKEKIKSLNGNVDANTVKIDMDEIETLNIELEHRVTKLVAENEHLKQTYKQLYDSIKPKRVQSKEQ
ncbi:hypothetical protein Tco_0976050 [Tanacetum coccineum]|uniref:Uncharacterized protein n=1 Tax=Tanacetum coccineum TaxID=301880 RepID=A0ABQ5EG54_9ASTR